MTLSKFWAIYDNLIIAIRGNAHPIEIEARLVLLFDAISSEFEAEVYTQLESWWYAN